MAHLEIDLNQPAPLPSSQTSAWRRVVRVATADAWLAALVLVQLAVRTLCLLSMPFLTLVFRNYYKGIPQEIMSAAMMDSGWFWKIFLEIILRMSGNILIVVVILQITSIWNDYLIGVTFGGLTGQPMTVNLANLITISTGTTNYAHNMAAALLTAIPPLVVYFLVGKLFVQGVTAGAIKG